MDCDDGSDESDCNFLVVNEDYVKDKLPLTDVQEGPVQVSVSNKNDCVFVFLTIMSNVEYNP